MADQAGRDTRTGCTGDAPVRYIDAFDCAARGLSYQGSVPIMQLPRFSEDLPAQDGVVVWSLRGSAGALGEPLLLLDVKAEPQVTCQRCLGPFAWPIDEDVALHLVRSEDELDDGEPDDVDLEGYDRVLGSTHFDVLAQVEDALILAMPYIARHPVCPDEAGQGEPVAAQDEPAPEQKRPHPFAGLSELKGRLRKE